MANMNIGKTGSTVDMNVTGTIKENNKRVFTELATSGTGSVVTGVSASNNKITVTKGDIDATVGGFSVRPHVGEHVSFYGSGSAENNLTSLTGSYKNLIRNGFEVVSDIRDDWAEVVTAESSSDIPIIKIKKPIFGYIFWSAYVYNGFTVNDNVIVTVNIDYKSQTDPGSSNFRTTRMKATVAAPYTIISGHAIRHFDTDEMVQLMGYNGTGSRGYIAGSGQTKLGIIRLN